jgi:fibro-slime domain-containing protein
MSATDGSLRLASLSQPVRTWRIAWAATALLAPAMLFGCGGDSDKTCMPGTEKCACRPNLECNAGLTCFSDMCVNASADGAVVDTPRAVLPDDAGKAGLPDVPSTMDGSVLNDGPIHQPTTDGPSTDTGATSNADGALPDRPAITPPPCGDGLVVFPEQCDDGNNTAGDGCSPSCRLEIGWKCNGSPSICSHTTCGDKKIEGAETCDDGNALPFDGCSADCQPEPDCGGGACVSACGDGFVFPNEECDDGNRIDGDGCSKDCKKEPGWTCAQVPMEKKMLVPMVARDFKYHNPSDFQVKVQGQKDPSRGMVEKLLNDKGKPVYTGLQGSAIKVESSRTFDMWYTDVPGTNHATASKLALWDNGKGAFVNRWGANGEQYLATEKAYYCGTKGEEKTDSDGNPIPCTSKTATSTECTTREAAGLEMLKCFTSPAEPQTYQAIYITKRLDGSPLWFPVDGDTTVTSKSEFEGARIPPMYETGDEKNEKGTWPYDLDVNGNKVLHDFSFTTEIRYWFQYETGKAYNLEFVGGDDLWVFVNGRMVVDIGGIHMAFADSVDLAAVASSIGLKSGNVYEVAIFHAERIADESVLKVNLPPFNGSASECYPEGSARPALDSGGISGG